MREFGGHRVCDYLPLFEDGLREDVLGDWGYHYCVEFGGLLDPSYSEGPDWWSLRVENLSSCYL